MNLTPYKGYFYSDKSIGRRVFFVIANYWCPQWDGHQK